MTFKSYEEIREEEKRYRVDFSCEVLRFGGNPASCGGERMIEDLRSTYLKEIRALEKEIESLRSKLDIAEQALKVYADKNHWLGNDIYLKVIPGFAPAAEALEKMKGMEGK